MVVKSIEEVETAILAKAAKWNKLLFYLINFYECDPERSPRDIKKIVNGLVSQKKLAYWCTGATIMYALPERLDEDKS